MARRKGNYKGIKLTQLSAINAIEAKFAFTTALAGDVDMLIDYAEKIKNKEVSPQQLGVVMTSRLSHIKIKGKSVVRFLGEIIEMSTPSSFDMDEEIEQDDFFPLVTEIIKLNWPQFFPKAQGESVTG